VTRPRALPLALALIATLAVAVFFRAYQIDRIPPPSLQVDEAFYGVDALHVMQGERAIFFEANFGREPLFIYLAAGWMSLFGVSPVTFRLLSGAIGTLTVLAMFWLGREVFWDERGPANAVGLAAALFSAFLFVNVSYGRSAQRIVTFPLFVALVMAALARCLRTRRTRDALWTGALLGLSLYTYSTIRVLPIAVAVAFALWWAWERDSRFLVNGLFVAAVALVVFAPLGVYFVTHPDSFFFRALDTLTTDRLDVNLMRVLGLLVSKGDRDMAINLPKRPMLDGVQVAFALIGLVVGWIRRPRRAWTLTLLVWAVMLIPPVISAGPAFGRTWGSVPPLLLLLGVGLATPLEWAWRWAGANGLLRKLAAAGLTLAAAMAVIYSIGLTYHDYFLVLGRLGELPLVFQENFTAMGNLIRTLPADERILISPFQEIPPTMTFALHGDDPRVTPYDGRACVVLPEARPRSVSYLVILEDHNTLPALLRYAPNGRAADTRHFLFYQVPSGTAMQPRPQHPIQARWAEPIELLGYDIGLPTKDSLPMTLYWRAAGQIAEPYTAFVHLSQADRAHPLAQHDAPPCGDSYATQYWQVGDVVQARIAIQLSPDLSGDYSLRIGLYHTYLYTRLAIASTDRHQQDDMLLAETIHLGVAK